ncbi:MAG: hypothetical protein K2X46_06555 [Roseomonas sp.]|nr:hypothetical protein [Roseomonas sp.]
MPMTPDEIARCLDALPWSRREVARRLGVDDAALRKMARGARPVAENLAAWLRLLAALHGTLTPEQREIARAIGCDEGRFVRHPRGVRPLDDEEAALLETLAALHAALPLPVGWRTNAAQPDTDA